MKKKIISAAVMIALAFTVTACGGGAGKADEPASVEAGSSSPEENEALVDAETDLSDTAADPDSAISTNNEEMPDTSVDSGAQAQPEDTEQQYKDMAAKFAVYCEQVYLGYDDKGSVTAGDITITEDSETECRLTVYYNEPSFDLGNISADGGMGYMEFVIDKTTSQGQLATWNYLVGSESPDYAADQENPEVVDMSGEASAYYDFPENPVFDFKEGLILSSDSVATDVNDYFKE